MPLRKCLLAFSLLGFAAFSLAQEKPVSNIKADADNHDSYLLCAKACAACALECARCEKHCMNQVAEGKKDHMVTVGLCGDCGELCTVAMKTAARKGPLAELTCEACAKACDLCGAACDKHAAHDEQMAKCAKACRECAKACREMTPRR